MTDKLTGLTPDQRFWFDLGFRAAKRAIDEAVRNRPTSCLTSANVLTIMDDIIPEDHR